MNPNPAPSKVPDSLIRSQIPSRPLAGAIGGCSLPGLKDRNDDAIAGRVPGGAYEMHVKGIVAAIADGISTGRNSGEAARLSVVQFIEDYYSAPESWPVRDAAARLLASLNSWFHSQNRTGLPDAEGQVTTFTAFVLRSTTVHVLHIGDTRCYRLRTGEIEPLTGDHVTRVPGGEEALSRALGIEPDIRIDCIEEAMVEGDVYLLTSDGVHGHLSEETIETLLAGRDLSLQAGLEDASRALCEAALANGSGDNVSCLMVAVTALPSESLTEAHERLTQLVIPPVMKPGNRIDGFEVVEVLHASPRSHVYLVRSGLDRDLRVLKAPSRNFKDDLRYLEGFVLEQWVGRHIDHRQVMKILPHGESRFLYYTAERISGRTLREWMDRNRAPGLKTILPILESLVSAVRVFHRLSMVHRDLKPENAIVSEDGTVRIIDFGTVQVRGFDGMETGTHEGLPEGSLNYIAPEILAGGPASSASDLFSIGVVAYEMLTGTVPFDLENRSDVLDAKIDWTFRALEEHRPDLSPDVTRAIAKVLDRDPAKRPQAMSVFVADLRRAHETHASRPRFVPLLERGSMRVWRMIALLMTTATFALALSLIGFLANR